jgi:hypothetical protein
MSGLCGLSESVKQGLQSLGFKKMSRNHDLNFDVLEIGSD